MVLTDRKNPLPLSKLPPSKHFYQSQIRLRKEKGDKEGENNTKKRITRDVGSNQTMERLEEEREIEWVTERERKREENDLV